MPGKDILQKAPIYRHVCNVPEISARHSDNVHAPAACLGSERGIIFAPGRHSQNVYTFLFSLRY
jgi:hypothetical protein